MSIRSISQLKTWLKRGAYPTAEQFADWLDSFFHRQEKIPIDTVDGLDDAINAKYDRASGEALEQRQGQLEDAFEAHDAENAGEFTNVYSALASQAATDEQLSESIAALPTKEFVNSSIQSMSANPVTYDAGGALFPTAASLTGATTVYNQGVEYTPSKGDYATILADETAPTPFTSGQTRWVYDGVQWNFSFGINETPFTAAQNAAINSGIDAGKVAKIADKSTAIPLANGAASPGSSTQWSAGDHRHPTDTTRAPLASPAFSGTPTVPTAAQAVNNTQAASTAYVTTAVAAEASRAAGVEQGLDGRIAVVEAMSSYIPPTPITTIGSFTGTTDLYYSISGKTLRIFGTVSPDTITSQILISLLIPEEIRNSIHPKELNTPRYMCVSQRASQLITGLGIIINNLVNNSLQLTTVFWDSLPAGGAILGFDLTLQLA